jgi:hypothetical protein
MDRWVKVWEWEERWLEDTVWYADGEQMSYIDEAVMALLELE